MYFWIGYNAWFKGYMFAIMNNCSDPNLAEIELLDLEILAEEVGQLLGGN